MGTSRKHFAGFDGLKKGIILVGLLTTSTTLFCQESPPQGKVVIAHYTESLISIDGSLSESAWATAQPVTGFIQTDPSEGKPATEWTEVKVLYDDRNLYISAYCHDRRPEDIVVRRSRPLDPISSFFLPWLLLGHLSGG